MTDELYALAAGYDVAVGSLVKITSITPSSDDPFAGPQGIPHYNPGILKVAGDGLVKTSGFKEAIWEFGFMTYAQWAYLSTTYCAGGMSGKVTILTTLGSASYVRMNSIMILPKPQDLQADVRYKKTAVRFTRIAPAA